MVDREPKSELGQFLDHLWPRLPEYAERVASFPEGATGSIEWYQELGGFWWDARETAELSRREVALRVGADINSIRSLELGVGNKDEVFGSLPRRIAETLGKPELYDQYCEQFNIEPYVPKPPRRFGFWRRSISRT